MTFGDRLTAARKAKGLTQLELGKGLGTDGEDASKSVVLGWEKGRHFPKADQLPLICERLGCSADFLVLGTTRPAVTFSKETQQLAIELEALDPEQRRNVIDLAHRTINMVKGKSSNGNSNVPKTASNGTEGQRRAN